MRWVTVGSAVIVTLCLASCPDREQAHNDVTAAKQMSNSESFLEVIDDPAQVETARRIAAAEAPAPLSAEALADMWALTLDVIPPGMGHDEAMSQLRRVVQDPRTPTSAQCNAACLIAMLDPKEGQKLILQLLRVADAGEKRDLLLTLGFLRDDKLCIDNKELITELVSLIQDPETGTNAIQAGARLNLPEFWEILWKTVATARGAMKAEALFWLAHECPDQTVFEACVDALPQLAGRDREKCLMALSLLFKVREGDVGRESTEVVAGELLGLIAAGRTSIFEFPQSVCADVLKYGDGPKAQRLAEAVQNETRDLYLHQCAYVFKRRGEGSTQRESILRDLGESERFDFALKAVRELYADTGDRAIVAGLTEQIAERQAPEELEKIAQTLIAVGGKDAIAGAWTVCSRLPERQRNELLTTLEQESPVEVTRKLAAAGLIEVDDPEAFVAQLTKQKVEEYRDPALGRVGVLDILQASGILLSFDAETGLMPVRHDELIEHLAEASGGAFKPEGCYEKMLQKHEEDWDSPYRIQFVHGERLYRFTARNFGDWYDVERVALACNRALSDAQSPRKFFQVAGAGQVATLICVTPQQAQMLSQRFHVTWDDNLNRAMEEGKAYEEKVLRRAREEESR